MKLTRYTGKGIKVGIVDSGIVLSHPDVGKVRDGIGITITDGCLSYGEDYRDGIGHGTACTAIIRRIAPDVELYVVKIFEHTLNADERALVAAIHWLIEHDVDVINLSLCMMRKIYQRELREACNRAFGNRTMIIFAELPMIPNYLPADLPNVIRVIPGKIHQSHKYFYLTEFHRERFVARGCLQKVACVKNKYALREGASYAAPHISGIMAKICEAYPSASIEEIRSVLISNATELRDSEMEDVLYMPVKHRYKRDKTEYTGAWQNTRKRVQIQKAALYPYREETQIFVKERQLLNFEVVGVADTLDSGLLGKDAGKVLGEKPVGVKIVHSLESAMQSADTLIIGDVEELSHASRTDVLKDVMLKAIQCNKNVYSLTSLDLKEYEEIDALAQEKGLFIAYPASSWPRKNVETESETVLDGLDRMDVPIVAVFGTGVQQGKFELQLVLRRKLSEEGYQVGHIGTDPRSELFGADVCFPNDVKSALRLPIGVQVASFQRGLLELCKSIKPDIIVAGAQSEVVPYDIYLPSLGTFSSISLLYGLKPDAYILVVDAVDTHEYIQDSINVLEALGKGKTIALVMNDTKMKKKRVFRNFEPLKERMMQAEIEEMLSSLENKFHIPAVTIANESGRNKLVEIVINYFANEEKA